MIDSNNWQAVAEEELRFFGDISASISHEINNRFAVISEKAGLVQDLAIMLARGKHVEPNRFEVQGKKIAEQVRKAEHVVRILNRFSHSADVPTARIDITDMLGFVAELLSRKSAMAEVTLKVATPAQPISIRASPFPLENLIGRCIDIALSQSNEQRIVNIEAEETHEGLTVRFDGLSGFTTEPGDASHPNKGLPALLDCLGARIRSDTDGRALLLDLPYRNRSNKGGNHDRKSTTR